MEPDRGSRGFDHLDVSFLRIPCLEKPKGCRNHIFLGMLVAVWTIFLRTKPLSVRPGRIGIGIVPGHVEAAGAHAFPERRNLRPQDPF